MTHLQPHPPSPPRSWSTAQIAAVVTGVLAGVLLVALVIGLGMIFFRTVAEPSSRAAGPGPGPGGSGPQATLPGVPPPGQEEPTDEIPVVYEVTGTGKASVSYTVTEGSIVASGQEVTLPWRFELNLDADVFEITLGAVTDGDPPKGFGCTIVVGPKTVTDTRPDEVGSVNCILHPR